ncbi:uncharacterized protein LOC125897235 isoform X2 [Epinephelus fuscoguttatus]|nr:uncharacterized protein LOC125897235 isoform X2 [Epinephelus fuscoguttatus]
MEAPQSHFMEVTKGKQTDFKSKQTKRTLVMTSKRANKRFRRGQSTDMETNSLSHHTDLCPIQTADRDYCESYHQGEAYINSDTGNDCVMKQEGMGTESNYTCPLGESDLDSDDTTDSGSLGNQDHKSCSLSSDILRESESSCPKTRAPFLITTDISSSSPPVNSNVNPFASQPEISEETGAQDNMWKLRANRVKQILSEFGPFNWSKKVGLEFNVGFGPKQNISVDSLHDFTLMEIAKFALAMNSSQQNFIMEILEYNFDLYFKRKLQRNDFKCEIMETVRQLKGCQDTATLSREIFDSPHLLMERDQEVQSMSCVNPELSSVSRKEECDVAPICHPQSHAETKKHRSQTIVNPYPFCKEIGLKLHVNQCQQNKKLDFNNLTNGALTEVANFAEKLCGTFEQICLDLLRHNLDLDLQSGDSDVARNMLDRILFVMKRKNLLICAKAFNKIKNKTKKSLVKLDCQNDQNSDACSVGSPQDATIDQNVGSSPEPVNKKELNSMLWKLRANHIQHILSVPHEEHCPLYSYSRCKKLGIDFNVGSGVKQNLDPKLLTNGIMVEICTFATALLSAQKYFITEILEYNFHLNFNNESHRSAFAQQTRDKMQKMIAHKDTPQRRKLLFELPDMRSIQGASYDKATYCPKCYQEREGKLRLKKIGPGDVHWPHPHTMSNEVSADTDCIAQKPAKDPTFTFTAIEEKIMDCYPLCKKIGLSLFVKNDQPKDKLDRSVLTLGVMVEIADFVIELCATKSTIIHALLEHNFGVGMQRPDIDIAQLFGRALAQMDGELAWFNEVFIFQPLSHRQPGHTSKLEDASAMQISERKKTINKRKLALQTKEEGPTLRSYNVSGVKSMRNAQSQGNSFPICTDIGLDPDMTLKTGEKEKLDLKLLTKDVCDMTQEEVGTQSNYTCPLGAPFLITTDLSSSSPPVNSNVSPFASQPNKTQTPRNVPKKCDIKQEETGAQDNMWKLRANRVKQILSEFGPFYGSEKVGLEFNVGFGPKQNISVDSLRRHALVEVAKFALAMNSSQQHFIMEILEYNFDLNIKSESKRNIFRFEIMETVRQLKDSQGADKHPGEVFDSPHLLMECDQEVENVSSVNPELSSVSRKEGCDVAPIRYPQSHAETKDRMSPTMVDSYPFCKEMGLKLHVNQHQQNKKLDFDKLTNEALSEVANFAEKLCGTFEQISLDILRHNLDLDLQSGDFDLARGVLAQTPFAMERKNLNYFSKAFKYIKRTRRDDLTNVQLDCLTSPNLYACSAGSSQAATVHQNVDGSPEAEKQKELNSMLWKLRANHIQEILSIPHEEHCPLYSYSRCKKLGIDFNVGSGVKQNLDPKLLTNGIMIEICLFAIELLLSQRYFITEILEYNFHLNFNNELHRSAFAQQTCDKIAVALRNKRRLTFRMNMPFKLPVLRYIQDSTTYCPKCYQVRSYRLHQDESDPGHMHHPRSHTMTDTVPADANCTAQKLALDPSCTIAAEETIMDRYPRCKKIGLSLCVNKDQPKDKLAKQVLTLGIMAEVDKFAKELCGTKNTIIRAVLEHNFNVGPQTFDLNIFQLFHRVREEKVGELAWFNESFVSQPFSYRPIGHGTKHYKRVLALRAKKKRATLSSPYTGMTNSETDSCSKVPINYPHCTEIGRDLDITSKSGEKEKLDLNLLTRAVVCESQSQPTHASKPVEASATRTSERKETIKKRMLALQTKEKRPTLPSPNTSVVKSKTRQRSNRKCYPHCTEIGLDLDVTSKSGKIKKLNLDLLTRAVVCEIHKFAVKNPGNYMPHTLFDILDYNFDLSSQHHRRWEFSIATTSKVQAMVKSRNRNRPHEVFRLPFVFPPKTHNKKSKKHSKKKTDKKKRMGRNHSDSSDVDFLYGVETDEVAWSFEDTEFSIDPWSALPMCGSPVSEGCDSPLQGNIQIGEKEYDAQFGNMNPELDTETTVPMSGSLESEACGSPVQGNIQTKEEKYDPQYGNTKPELDTGTTVLMSGSLESEACGSPVQGNIQIKEEKYDPQYGNMKPELDTGTTVLMSGSLESEACGSPLQGNIQIKEEKYDPQYGNMKPEPDTEEKYCPQYDDVKTEPDTEGAEHSVPGQPTEPLGYTSMILWPNSEEPQTESENQYVQYYIRADTQGPALCPNTVCNIKIELGTEGVKYLVPVQVAGSQENSMVLDTLIKEEQGNVPADSQH